MGLRPLLLALTVVSTVLVCQPFIPPAHAADLKDDDLLLLDFVLERQRLATSVTAYAVGKSAVVSLAEAGAAFEFPIIVDPAAGTASGWLIRPERTFTLNIAEGLVEIEGKRQPFTRDEAFVHKDAIFVTVEALSRWFPVDLRLQSTTLSIDVTPREKLPVQERQARRSGQQISGVGPATLPLIETPYKLVGPHAADIGLGYSIRRPSGTGKATTSLNYSALLSGDLVYMDSHFYLNGSDQSALSQARFNLSRDKLGMPLGLRYVELGDIVPATVPGVSYNGVERGILIQGGGSAIGRDDLITGDIINISGDALPGWDVELFQNGMRIGLQTIGADGRYNFTNLDPFAGENKFELMFYGPAGERRSETVTRYSGLTPDRPGSVRYQFSASQKGQQIYRGDAAVDPTMSDISSTRLAAGMEIRVLPKLSLRGSWNNLMVDGQRLNYSSLGAATAWKDISISADSVRDPINGTRWNGAIQLPAKATIWGFDTRFSHSQYAQSVLVNDAQTTDKYAIHLTSRTGVTMSGPIGRTKTQFSLFHNQEVDRSSNSASAGFTARSGNINFGNTLNYYQFGRTPDGLRAPDQLTGNLFFNTGSHPLWLRGGLSYALKPDTEAREYFLDGNLTIAQDMTMNIGLTYNPLSGVTRYISGLNWQLPQVTLSPRISYSSDGEYSGFVYAAFSLAPRPDRSGLMISGRSLATNSTVAARVFLDHDGNDLYSAGDEPVPNVTIRAPQAYRTGKTDELGVAYLTDLSSARATDVTLDMGSLPNSQMASTREGNSVKPRPTAMAVIDFPMIPTGTIDGHVYTLQQGKRIPLAGAMIELRNAEDKVVGFKLSALDGFYEFMDRPFATYYLGLAGKQRNNATQPKVSLNKEKNLHSDIDIVLTPRASVAPAAESIVPRPVAPVPPAAPVSPAAAALTAIAARPALPPPPLAIPSPQKSPDGRLAQLGAFGNIDSAKAYKEELLKFGLIQADQIEIVTVNLGEHGLFHRVVAKPVGMTADALCNALKARGAECITIAP
jgi:cell division septation protein DedD